MKYLNYYFACIVVILCFNCKANQPQKTLEELKSLQIVALSNLHQSLEEYKYQQIEAFELNVLKIWQGDKRGKYWQEARALQFGAWIKSIEKLDKYVDSDFDSKLYPDKYGLLLSEMQKLTRQENAMLTKQQSQKVLQYKKAVMSGQSYRNYYAFNVKISKLSHKWRADFMFNVMRSFLSISYTNKKNEGAKQAISIVETNTNDKLLQKELTMIIKSIEYCGYRPVKKAFKNNEILCNSQRYLNDPIFH